MSETTDAAAQAPANPDAPTLQITDIQNAIRVIDFAAEQGAFKGWNTIEQVLTVRNRLNDFLRYVLPAAPAEETEPTTPASDEPVAG